MSTVSKYNNRPYWNVVCMCTTLGCAVQAWKCAPSLYCLRHRETEHPGWRKGSWCWHTFGDTDTQMSKMYTKTLPQCTCLQVTFSPVRSRNICFIQYLFMPRRNSNRRRPSGIENTRITVPCQSKYHFTMQLKFSVNNYTQQWWEREFRWCTIVDKILWQYRKWS